MPQRVAVIGAGCSGLTATKCCLDEGLEPVCFENHYEIGGLWHYTDDIIDNRGCVLQSTVTINSKEMLSFSDYPAPFENPNFMHHTKVWEYLSEYAQHFGLHKHIRCNTDVISIEQAEGFHLNGQWLVQSRNVKTDDIKTEVFDAVMVCSGNNTEKKMPYFEGMSLFGGRIMHSHDYKNHHEIAGMRIVVVGFGNSAADIITGRIGEKTFWSTRRGGWVLHRSTSSGLPADQRSISRLPYTVFSYLPASVYTWYAERNAMKRFDHELYGLKPKHRINSDDPVMCDELANRIACGGVIMKPDIKRLTKSGVEFTDGSFEDNIDLIVCATGYFFSFQYVKQPDLEVKYNRLGLYKCVFPPNIRPATLAVIGIPHSPVSTIAIAELQSRWVTRVFKGNATLPDPSTMWEEVRRRETHISARYVDSTRHATEVGGISYTDSLANEIGCKPNLKRLLLTDPRLAWVCFTGPCTPYQYRLQGPGFWSGARDAILNQWGRTLKPFQTMPLTVTNKKGKFYRVVLTLLLVILVLYLLNSYKS